MKKSIESKIRLKVALIYFVIAILLGGMLVYIYFLRKDIQSQKSNINQYNTEFVLANNLIYTVQQAQSAANLYIFSYNQKYLSQFWKLSAKIELQIDSLTQLSTQSNQDETLHEISDLLKKKAEIVSGLTTQFTQYNPIAPLHKKIQDIDSIVSETPIIVSSKQQDTIISAQKKRNLWYRIGDVFAPGSKVDTVLRITTKVDTVVGITGDSLSLISDIKQISREVSKNYEHKISSIEKQVGRLIISDQEISAQMSDLLIKLHRGMLASILAEIQQNEQSISKNYTFLIVAGVIILALILVFIFLIISDVNKGYAARRALEIAQKRTEEIMASRHKLLLSISHDIKAPLTSIIGYLELWNNDSKLAANEHKKVLSMQNSAKHILSLLTNLLDFSSLEQQKQQVVKSNFDLHELCNEVAEMFTPLALHKNILFNHQYNIEENGQINSDYVKIKQILINVLSNAVKYTLQGKITFTVSSDNDNVLFHISDTGVGISKDKINSIYKPFSRIGDNAVYAEGSGFGMYVVKGLIDLLHGQITIASEVGKGTQIDILLPVDKAIATASIASSAQPLSMTLSKSCKILVIDDDKSLLTMISEMLTKLGHVPITCNTLPEFEQQLPHITDYDMVLTDMDMGTFSGKDILKKVKQTQAHIPIFVMTAQGDFSHKNAENSGFTAYLAKPFSMAALFNLINRTDNNIAAPLPSPASAMPPLFEMFGDDHEAIKEVLTAFVQSTESNMELLNDAITRNDFQAAQAVCHKILPMYLQLGEIDLADVLKTMDSLRGQSADQYPQWKGHICDFIAKSKKMLTKLSEKYLD